MTLSQTVDGGLLRKAAEPKKDESILLKIRDKDCVAVEAQYHRNCCQMHTKFISSSFSEKEDIDHLYAKAFDVFCSEFIMKRVIENRELLYLKDLLEKFIVYAREVEDVDASSYQSSRLKARLLKMFPMLHIHTPSNVSKSQIVYSEDLTVGEVADNYVESSVLSNSQDGCEEENDDAVQFKVRNNILSPLYNIAMYRKQIIKHAPGIGPHYLQI